MQQLSPHDDRTPTPGGGSALWLIGFWTLSRIVMLFLWQALCSFVRNDVNYYAMSVSGLPVPVLTDLTGVLIEYPTPLVWLIQVLEWPSAGSVDLYVLLFAVLVATADGVCCAMLHTFESARAAWVWAACGALLGPLLWFRLDIVPALCVLGALHQMSRRPALAGALLALGAGFKLWPALLVLPMLGRSRTARRRGAGFVLTGMALVLLSVATSGLGRTVSPLTWQSERGLQIESVWATPLMLARALGATGVDVQFSDFKAYEVFAASVGGWRIAASAAMIILVALSVALSAVLALREQEQAPISPGTPPGHEWAVRLAALAIICGWIVANKTLSPQYMTWLFGPLALVASGLGTPDRAGAARRLVAAGLTATALTQLVYPLTYSGIISAVDPNIGSTMMLVLRNLCVVALAVLAWVEAFVAALGLKRSAASPLSPRDEPRSALPTQS